MPISPKSGEISGLSNQNTVHSDTARFASANEAGPLVSEYLTQGKYDPLSALRTSAAADTKVSNEEKTEEPHTYLEKGVDKAAALFVGDKKTRLDIDHYASQFLTSAALFSRGKLGIAGTVVLYGLATASPDSSLAAQCADFALGATKGLGTRAIFSAAGHLPTAPLKGVVTGIGARTLDAVVSRDTFSDPSKTLSKLHNDTFNRNAMLTDAVTWTIGEGLFHGINKASGGALSKSALAHGFSMGASFGAVNGTSNEIARERANGEAFDLARVTRSGLIEAGISGAAAAAGGRIGARPAAFTEVQKPLQSKPIEPVERVEAVKPTEPVKPPETVKIKEPEKTLPVSADNTNLDPLTRLKAAMSVSGIHNEGIIGPAESGDKNGQTVSISTSGPGLNDGLADLEGKVDIGSLKQTTINRYPDTYFDQPADKGGDKKSGKGEDKSGQVEFSEPPNGLAPSPTREFVIDSGKDKLRSFRERQTEDALLQVREVFTNDKGKTEYGPRQTLFVQHFERGDSGSSTGLKADAQKADIVVTSHPELLSEADRRKHAFPDGEGKVWMSMSGKGSRLRLVAGEVQVSQWKKDGYIEPLRLDNGNVTLSVMAPLLVGEAYEPGSEANKPAWEEFDRQLKEAKALGIDAVSTDVWWGLIEPHKDQFNWQYYEKLSDHIIKAGMKWVPILSFHRCGGNVGDDVSVPLPSWIWGEVAAKTGGDVEAVKYKSEQGHTSSEYVSLWADQAVMDRYVAVMKEFHNHFQTKAPNIGEINVSLGPAGEMRYPSYNSHDNNTGYPTRGALQAYSPLAIDSFRQFTLDKYGSYDGVGKAWGIDKLDQSHILPPSDVQGFFDRGDHFNMQYGRDFFDWYNQSLVDHGRRMMNAASSVFGTRESPYYGIDLGAKVPGVHWRVGEWQNGRIALSDRQAELSAGLIRTSRGDWDNDADGRGYRPIFSMFKEVQPATSQGSRIVPAFTCLEMPDGDGGPAIKAMPHSLATWAGQEAERQGLWLKGENALNGNLYNDNSWTMMRSFLNFPGQHGYYHGLTFLRMGDVVNNNVGRNRITEFNTARWRTTGSAAIETLSRSLGNIKNMIKSAVAPGKAA